jgi:hypothetical protein
MNKHLWRIGLPAILKLLVIGAAYYFYENLKDVNTAILIFFYGMMIAEALQCNLFPLPKDEDLFDKDTLIEKKDLDELSKTAREKIAEQSVIISTLQERLATMENLINEKEDKKKEEPFTKPHWDWD